jgi:ChrR Cupin-like domain
MTSNKHLAADYVMGALSADERAYFNVRRLYDRALNVEIVALEESYGELADAPPFISPKAPDMWSKIKQAALAEDKTLAGMPIQPFGDGEWEPHGAGIDFKPLWQEGTILIRCEPGGSEEEHENPADQDEHILVMAGDLHMGGRVFETGAYICIPAGTVHPRMQSKGGCILFTQYLG